MHLAYIKITKNNINISITDIYGDVIIQKTSGSGGYRSIESNSEIASSGLARQIALEFKNLNVSKLGVYINGVTLWKLDALRSLIDNQKNIILFIRDISGLPHNGCSAQKKKRKKQHKKDKLKY